MHMILSYLFAKAAANQTCAETSCHAYCDSHEPAPDPTYLHSESADACIACNSHTAWVHQAGTRAVLTR